MIKLFKQGPNTMTIMILKFFYTDTEVNLVPKTNFDFASVQKLL